MRDALNGVGSIVVLGGSSEIGLAIVERLATPRLHRVVLAGPTPERLDQAAARLRGKTQAEVVTETFDVTQVDAHGALLDRVFAAGDVDLAVVAAGVLGDDDAARGDGRLAASIWSANFTGPGAAMLETAERMKRQGHGTIVVLSSVAGERPRASNFVYGSSKAGLDAVAQGLSDSLQGTGVSVLVVRPGFVKTRMTEGLDAAPLATTPEAVAERVADGLRSGAHTVWAPRAMQGVMVILRHLPRPIFKRLKV